MHDAYEDLLPALSEADACPFVPCPLVPQALRLAPPEGMFLDILCPAMVVRAECGRIWRVGFRHHSVFVLNPEAIAEFGVGIQAEQMHRSDIGMI